MAMAISALRGCYSIKRMDEYDAVSSTSSNKTMNDDTV